jgi:1-deoxy-D-xylulose-5-phosphate reductoisomerase
MTIRRSVTVLGSTGSIGVSTLDVLARAVEAGSAEVELKALTAGRNVNLLIEQALRWRPERAVIRDESGYPALKAALAGTDVEAAAGEAAVVEAACGGADWVMAAIVGSAGLTPAMAAVRSGATVALANKESIVCGGPALMQAARASGGAVVPVDSEHSAIFQALACGDAATARIVLTASGGPFRTWSAAEMRRATPEQAVAHPNWSMGVKNSVDSATLMNKGLEMIEASYLFDVPEDRIDVLIHPQSIVHSLVEFEDGSTIAQLSPPDMRTPIAFAFSWPERMAWPAPKLDLARTAALTFEAPDAERFPAIGLARAALRRGGAAPAAFNAANEEAVNAFMAGRIGFLDIAAAVGETLDRLDSGHVLAMDTGDDVLERALTVDRDARQVAAEVLTEYGRAA